MAGTGKDNPNPDEILVALREPEGFRRFYPEAMRAGTRAMISLLRPFWPPKLADILEASLNESRGRQTGKDVDARKPWALAGIAARSKTFRVVLGK